MASLVSSNDYELFQGTEVSDDEMIINNNDSFLMSFMEELQDHQEVEENDEERLNSVIQSLEAEINSSTSDVIDDHQMDGQDYWAVSMDEISGWEQYNSVMPSSPSHDMNLYMYSSEDHEMSYNYGVINGFEGDVISTDYLGASLDLDQYSSLWQETVYESAMFE